MYNTKILIIYHMKIKGQITEILTHFIFHESNVFSIDSLFIKTTKYIFVSAVFLHFK